MLAHPLPRASQRVHWYAKPIGCTPFHVPGAAVSFSPSRAVPEIFGREAFSGDCAAATSVVAFDSAAAAPAEFVAVTDTRSERPASPEARTYVWLVASRIAEQLDPAALQRVHWYEKTIGVVPLHEPLVAVSVCPTRVVPETVGAALLTGGVAAVAASAAPDTTTARPQMPMKLPSSARTPAVERRSHRRLSRFTVSLCTDPTSVGRFQTRIPIYPGRAFFSVSRV